MPATDHSWDGARPPRTGLTKSPPPTSHSQEPSSPPTNSPGDDKSPRGKNNGDYPIGRPTSPPAPSPTVAPTGRCSARKKETRQRLTIHSARTRSHVNTKTRPLVAKKTGATTPRDRARKSGAQKITQRSPSVSATQEQTPNRRTDTPSAPPPHREDPTQSAHYRLWGPGFLDVSLVPEEQEPATPTGAPTQARVTETMNLDAIAGLQADELQKLIEILQGLAAAWQEPTRQPPVQTATSVAEDKIQWEQLSTGQLPATEAPQVRPPPTQNPVITHLLTREGPQSNPRPRPQVATFAAVYSQHQRTDS